MACDLTKLQVMNIVRGAIKASDPSIKALTQDTFFDYRGLGHAPARRRSYFVFIRDAINARGCALRTLTANSMNKDGVDRVRDLSELVFGDLA